jgi:hypothetical protein
LVAEQPGIARSRKILLREVLDADLPAALPRPPSSLVDDEAQHGPLHQSSPAPHLARLTHPPDNENACLLREVFRVSDLKAACSRPSHGERPRLMPFDLHDPSSTTPFRQLGSLE